MNCSIQMFGSWNNNLFTELMFNNIWSHLRLSDDKWHLLWNTLKISLLFWWIGAFGANPYYFYTHIGHGLCWSLNLVQGFQAWWINWCRYQQSGYSLETQMTVTLLRNYTYKYSIMSTRTVPLINCKDIPVQSSSLVQNQYVWLSAPLKTSCH